jgi:hypothetical protein
MSAKNILIDFINYLFIILLVLLCFLYFIDPERFQQFTELMRAMVPLAVFSIIFLIKLKFIRVELESKKEEGSTDIVLFLVFFDKVKADLVTFGIPMLIILLKLIITGAVEVVDILAAAISFVGLYVWHRYLFNKVRT